MRHKIQFGTKSIEFDLIYSKRKTLGITVKPDSSVVVRAPGHIPLDFILRKVKKKSPWILRQMEHFHSIRPSISPKEYVSGESFHYLGRQYRLKVSIDENCKRETVKLKGGFLFVNTKAKNRVKYLLDKWYADHALIYFDNKVRQLHSVLRKYNIPLPMIKIRKMKTRWGSCSRKGNITLNTHLIKAPSHCIEYVIMHELCHLKYFNHSREYYLLLYRVMPDWEKRKKRLEKVEI